MQYDNLFFETSIEKGLIGILLCHTFVGPGHNGNFSRHFEIKPNYRLFAKKYDT